MFTYAGVLVSGDPSKQSQKSSLLTSMSWSPQGPCGHQGGGGVRAQEGWGRVGFGTGDGIGEGALQEGGLGTWEEKKWVIERIRLNQALEGRKEGSDRSVGQQVSRSGEQTTGQSDSQEQREGMRLCLSLSLLWFGRCHSNAEALYPLSTNHLPSPLVPHSGHSK